MFVWTRKNAGTLGWIVTIAVNFVIQSGCDQTGEISASPSTFNESTANDGSVDQSVLLTFKEAKVFYEEDVCEKMRQLRIEIVNEDDVDARYARAVDYDYPDPTLDGETLVEGKHYEIESDLPEGLGVKIVKVQSQSTLGAQARMTLTGKAAQHEASDSFELKIRFKSEYTQVFPFQEIQAKNATVREKGDELSDYILECNEYQIDFDDVFSIEVEFDDSTEAAITYDGSEFNERSANDGRISGSVAIALTGGKKFRKSSGTLTIADGDYAMSGTAVPSGLSPKITLTSDTAATLTFTGTAASHEASDSVSDVTLTFKDQAFSDGKAPTTGKSHDFDIDFEDSDDASGLDYSATAFVEASTNNGSVTDTVTITLSEDTFSQSMGTFTENTHYTLTGTAVPTGLSPVVTVNSATEAELSFMGNATPHDAAASVTGIVLTFLDDAFTSGAAPTDGSKDESFSISFSDPFITLFSTGVHDGDLGGRAGADALCAGAQPGSSFQANVRALISVDASDEIRDMPGNYMVAPDEEIRSPDGNVLASDWSDLIDGSIDENLMASGVTTSTFWWSGSDNMGALSASNCAGWTDGTSMETGATGFTADTANWFFEMDSDCDGGILGDQVVLCIAFD